MLMGGFQTDDLGVSTVCVRACQCTQSDALQILSSTSHFTTTVLCVCVCVTSCMQVCVELRVSVCVWICNLCFSDLCMYLPSLERDLCHQRCVCSNGVYVVLPCVRVRACVSIRSPRPYVCVCVRFQGDIKGSKLTCWQELLWPGGRATGCSNAGRASQTTSKPAAA